MRISCLNKILPICAILSLLIKVSANAYEPPTPKFETAFKNSKSMFVGRVISIKETQRFEHKTLSTAKIQLIYCYFGINCNTNTIISIQYYSDTLEDGSFPINLSIGREVLFLLQKPICNVKYEFDSKLAGGVDFAYEIDVKDVLENFQEKYASNADNIRLTNLYWTKHKEWISKSEINEIVKKFHSEK